MKKMNNIPTRYKPVLFIVGFFAIFFIYTSNTTYAQQTQSNRNIYLTLEEVALLDIEPNTQNVVLSPTSTSLEAGISPLTQVSDNSKWLNYSSAVTPGTTRNITAQIINNSLPSGINLKLEVSNCTTGGGSRGSSLGEITLSSNPKTIISGIGGAYTGDGENKGHQLEYSLEVTDISQIDVGNTTLTIIYTLSN